MKIKKRSIVIAIAAIVLLAAIGYFSYQKFFAKESAIPGAYLTPEGLMKLPQRESVRYEVAPLAREDNANYTIYKVVYESAGLDIHGLLLEPKREGKVPGVVLLPGAGVDKTSELPLARTIASLGYEVLVIDQRGIGETGSGLPPLEQDFKSYKSGNVAFWHLPVVDALIAADVLSTREAVDPSNIILVGESFGGRIAMIAAGVDSRMKGVVAISSAGIHYLPSGGDAEKDRFIGSLDPDNYVPKLSPRPLFMIHSVWDKTVPVGSATATFEKAGRPKLFITVNSTSCGHGYCDMMLRPLNLSLATLSAKAQ